MYMLLFYWFMPFMFIAPCIYTWVAYVNLNNKHNDDNDSNASYKPALDDLFYVLRDNILILMCVCRILIKTYLLTYYLLSCGQCLEDSCETGGTHAPRRWRCCSIVDCMWHYNYSGEIQMHT